MAEMLTFFVACENNWNVPIEGVPSRTQRFDLTKQKGAPMGKEIFRVAELKGPRRKASKRHQAFDLVVRLTTLMQERGTTPTTLSRDAGLGQTAVHDILRGKSKAPSIRTLKAIAGALHCRLDELVEGRNGEVVNIDMILKSGHHQYRAWNPKSYKIFKTLKALKEPYYQEAHHFAVWVGDDSMNQANPYPLYIDMYALCIDCQHARIKVENDRLYVVRTVRVRNHRREAALMIRHATVTKDKTILSPMTTDPRFFEITISGLLSTNVNDETHAVGLVYGVMAKTI